MPVHDRYARVTPFELNMPNATFADERFPAVEAEAKERGVDLSDPSGFALLSEAGLLLREIRGDGEEAQLIQQHAALLFHSFHFWKAGRPLFLLEERVVRFLTAHGPEEGAWDPVLPTAAGYVQLPQHLVWAPGGEGGQPESIDGLFWAAPSEEAFSLLVVMGIRKDRPGISVVQLPTLPLTAAAPWAAAKVREEGDDFASSIPGAELEGLYSLEAGAEALKLAMRVFWYLDSSPETPEESEPRSVEKDEPPASVFPFHKVRFKG